MESSFSFATIKAIIGLGNPGQQYARNRHNIGFRLVDELVEQSAGTWRTIGEMAIAEIRTSFGQGEFNIIVIKPQTFMNSSGRVIPYLQKKGIKSEEILVVHDELEKEFAKTQIRLGGSARGHNGLKSLIGAMGEKFWRLRFGIGRPTDKADVPDYVLSNFNKDEEGFLAKNCNNIWQNI